MNDLENLESNESFENIETFKNQSKEAQRLDLLEFTRNLIEYSNQVTKDCKCLENKIDTIRDTKILLSDITIDGNIYNSLAYEVMQVDKSFKRLNSFIKIYLKN